MVKESKKILIFWASGFLWKKVYNYLSEKHSIIWTKFSSDWNNSDLIICNVNKIIDLNKIIETYNPNIIINAVWLADPVICEQSKKDEYNLNYKFVEKLVSICNKLDVKLIHFSTDYIFNGKQKEAIEEETKVNPINYYWKLKVKTEKEVKKLNNYIIIRIPILFGFNDKNDKSTFVINILNSLKLWEEIYLDDIQIRYPVLIDEIAVAIEKLLKDNIIWIINIASKKWVTKYAWWKIIAKEFWYDLNLIQKRNMSKNEMKSKPVNNKFSLTKQNRLNIKISDINKSTKILFKQFNCGLNLVYKLHPKDTFWEINVADYRISCGKSLKDTILTNSEDNIILPIPESWIFSAVWLSKYSKVPYIPAITKNSYYGRLFHINNKRKRIEHTEKKLIFIPELINAKNIYLVDEAIFTWITLKFVINNLKKYNPKSIHIRIPSPLVNKKCRYYMQPIRKLLWETLSKESMKKYFWVDSIEFIKANDFLNLSNTNTCFDCFKLK